jgi:hypothetical protein
VAGGGGWFEYTWTGARVWKQQFRKQGGDWETRFPGFNSTQIFKFSEIVAHTALREEVLRLIDAVSLTKLVVNWV